ncbi:MAG: DUF4131 domain-containing protein, partial [Gammaproteobacteria bacterium]|nr:DUF4131 domain-containing protein [Gammaproteobacteria bacterium]
MRIGSVLYLAGVCYILQFERLPELHYFIFFTSILIFLHKVLLARYVIWFLGGCIWTIVYSNSVLEQRLIPDLESEEISITGRVISLPDYTQNITRFNLNVTSSRDSTGKSVRVPNKIRLSLYLP